MRQRKRYAGIFSESTRAIQDRDHVTAENRADCARAGARITLGSWLPKLRQPNQVGLSDLLDFVRPRHRMVLTTFRRTARCRARP